MKVNSIGANLVKKILGNSLLTNNNHTHLITIYLSSVLCISYWDDFTIGGSCADILWDLMVVREAESFGLNLNLSKCEIITEDNTILGTILTSLFGVLQVVDPAHATLPGSPLGDGKCVANAIGEKTASCIEESG